MRKHFRSDLRASSPLHLEIFEDRCLLSGANSLLIPSLLSPNLLAPPTIPAPGLTHVALPTVKDVGVTAQTGTVLPNGAGVMGTALDSNTQSVSARFALSSILTPGTPVVVASSASLTGGIAATLPDIIGVVNAVIVPVSAGTLESLLGVVSVPSAGAVGVSAAADLKLNDAGGQQVHVGVASLALPGLAESLNVGLGGPASPNVGVKLGVQSPNPGSGADLGLSGIQGLSLQGNADSRRGGGTGLDLGGFQADTSAPVQGTTPTSEGIPATEIPFRFENEPQTDVVHGPAPSDPTAEATLENSPLITFLPLQTSFLTGGLDDLAAEAGAGGPSGIDRPVAVAQATINGGVSEVDADSPIPSPRAEGMLAGMLPFDLASLEQDMQAFLEQIEQLGGELSSLLGRMNLAPWLVAIAVTTIAGEIARQRLQAPRRGPLLAACEGATFAWFPGLCGPWSREEL